MDQPDPLELVQRSFARLAPMGSALAARFYELFFQARPDLEALFPPDLGDQHRKLAGAISLALHHLRDPEALEHALDRQARAHARLKLEDRDFVEFSAALLAAIAEFEGERWTPELRDAWRTALGEIVSAYLRALHRGA